MKKITFCGKNMKNYGINAYIFVNNKHIENIHLPSCRSFKDLSIGVLLDGVHPVNYFRFSLLYI